MTEHQDFPPALWAENLDELDREIARLAPCDQLLMLNPALREKSLEALEQAKTEAIEDYVIERLTKSFPDLGEWPPA